MRERIHLKRGLLISYNIKRQTDKAKDQGYSTIFISTKNWFRQSKAPLSRNTP